MEILLVDDDANIRTVAVIGLEDEPGWSVTEASSGFQALEAAAGQALDVILLDMMMPGMDGMTTFGKIRELENCKNVPIIFMTAKVQKNEVDGYTKLGAAGVIIKPFDPLSLAQEIMAILEKAKEESRA